MMKRRHQRRAASISAEQPSIAPVKSVKFGQGRVVVLGEAGMLTAQLDDKKRPFGMNCPGIDNKQLALNIMHWLSGLLD